MSRILLSWMAKNADFIRIDGQEGISPNPDGPTALVHNYLFDYDYHIMLSTSSEKDNDIQTEFLVNYLRTTFKHDVQPYYTNIQDRNLIDLKEIMAKIQPLLLKNRDHSVEIFISPGTPTMQVAWYLAHLELGLNTKLFQTRPQKFITEPHEKIYVQIEKSRFLSGIIIWEELSSAQIDKEFLISNSIKPVFYLGRKIASTDKVTVLILGETGTGKEVLAKYIHDQSSRSTGPFVPVNCSALGETLLESRLFGYVKDAHNMAHKDTKGLFEEAEGGTIFLDEIGDISPYMQQSLLRVMQEKEVTKIGSSKPIKVDVRVIAATNKDLYKLSNEGKFRKDLYYRLNVADLTLPPLRERGPKEIKELIEFFLKAKAKEFKMPILNISKEVRKIMYDYLYPGNIRELENAVERLYAVVEGEVTVEDLPKSFFNLSIDYSFKLIDVENAHIQKVLSMYSSNKRKTSMALDITINTLNDRIKRFGLL